MKSMKLLDEIKRYIDSQKKYKNQRKTVNLVGKREIGSGTAAEMARTTSKKLREMHIAYSMLLGNKYEDIEKKVRENNSPDMDMVSLLIEKYGEADE